MQRHIICRFFYLQVHLKIKLLPWERWGKVDNWERAGLNGFAFISEEIALLHLNEPLPSTAEIVVDVKGGAVRCWSLFAHLKVRLSPWHTFHSRHRKWRCEKKTAALSVRGLVTASERNVYSCVSFDYYQRYTMCTQPSHSEPIMNI